MRSRTGRPPAPIGYRRQTLGRHGEELACKYLMARGYVVLDRNWRCRYGEVDIVARHGAALVFCEVRTRMSTRCGSPLESITPAKARRMADVADAWLVAHGRHDGPVRLDAMGLLAHRGRWTTQHIRGVQP